MSAPAGLIAVPLLAGVVIGVEFGSGPPEALLAVTIGWILAAIAFRRRFTRGFVVALGGATFAIGAAIGGAAERGTAPPLLEWYRHLQGHDGSIGNPVRLTGRLRDDASPGANGVSFTLDVSDAGGRAVSGGARLTVAGDLAPSAASNWRAGRLAAVTALVREPVDYADPGVPSDRARLARQGIALVGTVKSASLVTVTTRGSLFDEASAALRAWIRTATADVVGHWSSTSAGVVTAILIGDRSGLSAQDERRLQDAGTYHVIAISGENIALLTAMLIALGRFVRLPARATAAASIVVLLFYGYTAGLAPSVLRATVGGVVYLAARAADHRGSVVNALAVAAACAGVTVPLTVFDPGFLLSFGATLAILVAVTRATPRREITKDAGAALRTWRWLWTEARALGAATICAEVALAPIAARLFGRVTFAGLLLNFAAIPLMSLIEAAGLAAVGCSRIWHAPALALGWIAHVATMALIRAASLVDRAPWLVVDVPAPSFVLMATWYTAWAAVIAVQLPWIRRLSAVVIAISASLILWAPPSTSAVAVPRPPVGWSRIVILDVGQGDATLVWPSGGRPMLVDAGGSPGSSFDVGRRVTVPAAWGFRVRSLDALVLTHGDPDHIGGAPAVTRALAPAQIWEGIPVPRHEPMRLLHDAAARMGIRWIEKRAGETLTSGAATIRVLNPPEPDWERQKVRNDDSIVLDVRVGGVAILLPGDVSRAVDSAIADAFAPASLVILKAPHHGSAGSSSPILVDALRPAAVIFSAGKRNPFGHPAPSVVDRYRAAGALTFSTAEDGAVIVDTDGTRVHIWTWGSKRQMWLRSP